jgi:hypothetical protein
MIKKCCKCKIEKPLEKYGKLNKSPDGLRYDCKDCRNEYNIQNREKIKSKNECYYKENKESLLVKNKLYRIQNEQNISNQRKEYRNRKDVKEHIKCKNKEYLPIRKEKIKEKRISNLNFKIGQILRSKIHKMLKNQKTSYTKYIGCDIEWFKKWIEFRFDENMNWNNLGSYWHIDHILPINRFNLINDNDKMICFHWTNLQPLESTENRQKSNKLKLHYYYNNIVNVYRFNKLNNTNLGYQIVNESLRWLRLELRYGKNPSYDNTEKVFEIDNPQPSL